MHDFDVARDEAGPPEKAKAEAGAWRLHQGLGGVSEKTTGGDSATDGAGREPSRRSHASNRGFRGRRPCSLLLVVQAAVSEHTRTPCAGGSKQPPQLPLEPAAKTHEQLIRRNECLC